MQQGVADAPDKEAAIGDERKASWGRLLVERLADIPGRSINGAAQSYRFVPDGTIVAGW